MTMMICVVDGWYGWYECVRLANEMPLPYLVGSVFFKKIDPGGAVGGRFDRILAANGAMDALLNIVGSSLCACSVDNLSFS